MNSKKNQWKINQWKIRKTKWKEIKKHRDMDMEIEKGVGNGTENEGGRLGANLPSTTACSISYCGYIVEYCTCDTHFIHA